MTEAEWQNETGRPQWMADHLGERGVARTKAGRRKLRLFACGCCRAAWAVLPDPRLRDAVVVAERFADGLASKDELAAARAAVAELTYDSGPFGRSPSRVRVAIDMAVAATEPQAYAAAFAMTARTEPLPGRGTAAGEAFLCDLFRCVFGNPFRPAAFDPSWRTAAVLALADSMYESRDFTSMPVLADALEEAGCGDAAILSHCRGPDVHCRGCRVVDSIRGKK
jgi:hypothetical protein